MGAGGDGVNASGIGGIRARSRRRIGRVRPA
jgi:hypothetical protein